MKQKKIPTILIIAGSDSGGGAGIQADIKAASYFKVFATTAVTAVTAQNTLGVQSIFPIPEKEIQKQLRSVIGDLAPDLIKIGMLGTKVVDCVAQEILPNKIILDPVMVATSGDKLVDEGCIKGIKGKTCPKQLSGDTNSFEAEILSGKKISSIEDQEYAAKEIKKSGSRKCFSQRWTSI